MSPKLLALAACCALAAPGAAPPQKIFPYSYTQEDLPNGLRLITVPTDFPNLTATYIVVEAGSRNEVEPGHTGFAHLFEHLMFKGTEKYPKARYEEMLRRTGAASNAYTTDDYTCYHTVTSKEDLPTVLAAEGDRFQNLKYTEAEFKTETLAVLGEYNKNASNPLAKLAEVLRDTAYDTSTYKHTTMGFLKDIQDMPNQYEYSLKFFDRYYRPEYTTIIVVGDAKPKAVRELVDKFWGAWKRGSYKPEIPAETPQREPRSNHVDWPLPTLSVLAVAYKGPAYEDSAPDTAALEALASLAFSPNSELYRKLVIEEQKAEDMGANLPQRVDPALFNIRVRLKNAADIDTVRDRIFETVKAFQEKPVEPARLEAVRKRLRYELALSMDSSNSIAQILAASVALRRTPETLNKLFEQYAALTPEDVQKAAAKYLAESARTVVTLTGPAGGAR